MGIEPGCTMKIQPPNTKILQLRRPYNLLSHEIFVLWNLQMISEGGNPQRFSVWVTQLNCLRKWIIFLLIWSMIQTGSPRHKMNIDPASTQTRFKYHKTMFILSPLTAGMIVKSGIFIIWEIYFILVSMTLSSLFQRRLSLQSRESSWFFRTKTHLCKSARRPGIRTWMTASLVFTGSRASLRSGAVMWWTTSDTFQRRFWIFHLSRCSWTPLATSVRRRRRWNSIYATWLQVGQ